MKSQKPIEVKVKKITKTGKVTLWFSSKLDLPPYVLKKYKVKPVVKKPVKENLEKVQDALLT